MSTVLDPLLGFAAGALTILSPCVIPLIPIVLGSAAQAHRLGPLALACGLVVSFTGSGFVLATFGAASGFDGDIVRVAGAALLLVAGFVLLSPRLQDGIARLAGPVADWAQRRQSGMERYGLAGQAGIGALLGLVWSPCVGPTLGVATVLAAQRQNLAEVASVMFAFGLGIATVLMLIATAARATLFRHRSRLMSAGSAGRRLLGGLLAAVAILILTGADRILEGLILTILPDWIIDLSVAL